MNSAVWKNKALEGNVARIQEDGHLIIHPLERAAFEYASQPMEINHVMSSIESVLSVVKLEQNLSCIDIRFVLPSRIITDESVAVHVHQAY